MSGPTLTHAIYEGWVSHHRETPRQHSFRYQIGYLYLDLDHLPQAFAGRWLWSHTWPTAGWFRREDHAGPRATPLLDTIRGLVSRATGARYAGRVFLMTQLRYWGFVMNPVSFYYCFHERGNELSAIVAEVHNTPWGEQHCYVLPVESATQEIWIDKQFHVSPFMPMQQRYRFRVNVPGESLRVSIDSFSREERAFSATMELQQRAWSTSNLLRTLWRFPFATQRIFAAIYWQAFRLWLKGTPYFAHPKSKAAVADSM
jgi:DUF1365 family protein